MALILARRSSRQTRARLIACGALLWSAVAAAQSGENTDNRGAPSGTMPVAPCSQPVVTRWDDVQLSTTLESADRDGLLFSATSSNGGIGWFDYNQIVTVDVVDSAGVAVPGQVVLAQPTGSTFVWRPTTPLAASAHYAVHVGIVARAQPSCPQTGASLQKDFAITTIAELSAAPPEPPLRAIAFGQAWSMTDMTCCAPRDTSACDDAETCAKCWSSRSEPTIVPTWDAAPTSTDLFEYALYLGSLTAIDPNAVSGFGFAAMPPAFAYRPLAVLNGVFAEGQREVCMTGVLRNVRTGVVALRTRCTDTTSAVGLTATSLPENVTLAPPADPTLVVGPAACLDDQAPYDRADVQVAATFHTHRDTCTPACLALFPEEAVPVQPVQPVAGSSAPPMPNTPVAGSNAPAMQNLPGDSAADQQQDNADAGDTGGCQVGAAGNASSALLVWMALWATHPVRSRIPRARARVRDRAQRG